LTVRVCIRPTESDRGVQTEYTTLITCDSRPMTRLDATVSPCGLAVLIGTLWHGWRLPNTAHVARTRPFEQPWSPPPVTTAASPRSRRVVPKRVCRAMSSSRQIILADRCAVMSCRGLLSLAGDGRNRDSQSGSPGRHAHLSAASIPSRPGGMGATWDRNTGAVRVGRAHDRGAGANMPIEIF